MSATIVNPLPVELVDGVFWLGECVEIPYKGELLHIGNSVYLVAGERCSALIDAGYTHHVPVVMDQLAAVIEERALPEIGYVVVTHSELPHAGGVGHILKRYPKASVVGEVSDLHLIFPTVAENLRFGNPGDAIDLGGTELLIVEAVLRDMPYSRWVFDTSRRVLFPADGFAFSHAHDARHCGHFVEDAPLSDLSAMMKVFAVMAFNYMEYIDIEPSLARLSELLGDLDPAIVAPTHGLPIREPRAAMAKIQDGLRQVSGSVSEGLIA